MGRKSDPFGMYDGIDVPEGKEVSIVDGSVADALYLFDQMKLSFNVTDGLYSYKYYSSVSDNALMGVFCHLLGEDNPQELYENIKKTFQMDGLYARSASYYNKPEMYTSACVGLLAFSLGEKEEAERIFGAFLKTDKDEIDGLLSMAILGKVIGRDGESKDFYDRAIQSSSKEALYSSNNSGYYTTKNSALKMVYNKLSGMDMDSNAIFDMMDDKIPKNNGLFVWGSHTTSHSRPSIDDNALVGIYLCLKGGKQL